MEYFLNFAVLFSIYAILALSLNMLTGMAGLLSLAQAAFYGVGAYAVIMGTNNYGLSFFASMVLGLTAIFGIAFLVGRVLSRYQSDYYTIVTAGLALIAFPVLLASAPLNMTTFSRPQISGYILNAGPWYLFLCLVILALVFSFYRFLDKSSFGRCLKSLREDEQLTRTFGFNTKHYKNIIFIIAALISGLAGTLLAGWATLIEPQAFQLSTGFLLFAVIIAGGLSSAWGSLVAALILISLASFLECIGVEGNTSAAIQQLVCGIALVIMMLFRPRGLFGKYKI